MRLHAVACRVKKCSQIKRLHRFIFERGGTAATYDSVAPLTWSSGCPINQGIFHACTSCPSFLLPKEHGILNMYAEESTVVVVQNKEHKQNFRCIDIWWCTGTLSSNDLNLICIESPSEMNVVLPNCMHQVNIFDIQHVIWTSLEGDVYKVNICYGKSKSTIHLSLVCL